MYLTASKIPLVTGETPALSWLADFHAGERACMEACYREHFDVVMSGATRILGHGADAETVVHEVFHRLLHDRSRRESFVGGSLGAWLHRVSRNHAIDFARRRQRESPLEPEQLEQLERDHPSVEQSTATRQLIASFRAELPDKWRTVFDARFMRQLSQREAADALGIGRTTLAYREQRVRSRLQQFARRQGGNDAS